MRETELKAVVPDESACLAPTARRRARTAVSEGRLEDRRYDYPDRRLTDDATSCFDSASQRKRGRRARRRSTGKARRRSRAGTSIARRSSLRLATPRRWRAFWSAGLRRHAGDRPRRRGYCSSATRRSASSASPHGHACSRSKARGRDRSGDRGVRHPARAFTADRLYMFVQRYEARTGQRAAICDDGVARLTTVSRLKMPERRSSSSTFERRWSSGARFRSDRAGRAPPDE